MLRQHLLNAAIAPDDRGYASVRGAQHHASCFQSAHLCDLVMLHRCVRFAIPGIVTDIYQQACLRQVTDDFFAKYILVANLHGNALARYAQYRLPLAAAR